MNGKLLLARRLHSDYLYVIALGQELMLNGPVMSSAFVIFRDFLGFRGVNATLRGRLA